MPILDDIFYVLYKFSSAFERGTYRDSRHQRVFTAVIMFSLLETLNVLTIFPKTDKELFIVPLISFLVINSIYFLPPERNRKIIERCSKVPPSLFAKSLIIFYCLGTVILFAVAWK